MIGSGLVDFFDRMAIQHADHVFCNPMSSEKFDELVGLLDLPEAGRVLDCATGKAELLRRIVRRWGCTGVGVDLSVPAVEEARQLVTEAGLSDAIEIVQVDGAKYDAKPESFDATLCIGASRIWGGHEGTLAALTRLAKPGGLIVVGEPHWRVSNPSPDYLEAAGMSHAQFATHPQNIELGEQLGLRLLHSIVSSQDDWDRYEGLQWRARARWVEAHPDHPDLRELQSTHDRDAYLRWGREELGWALYLFSKPRAGGG